jgi:hypothetical protein
MMPIDIHRIKYMYTEDTYIDMESFYRYGAFWNAQIPEQYYILGYNFA